MIRGKCHTFSDLCFVKVTQWWGGGGMLNGGGGSSLSLRTAPEEQPQGGGGGVDKMCGTDSLRFVFEPGKKTKKKQCRATVLLAN